MTRNFLAALAAVLVAAMALSAIGVGMTLPGELRLPIHWDLSGTPDRYAGKWVALLMPAAFTAAMSLLAWWLPALEPRLRNLERSQGLYLWSWAAILLVGTTIHIVVLSTALGWDIPTSRLIVGACGLLLLVIGNQLGKSRSMYMIGVRTPWTLASEEVWVRTHRLAGKLMVLVGLTIVLAAVLPLPAGLLTSALLVLIVLAVVVPILYSFVLWRRERRGADADGAQSSE